MDEARTQLLERILAEVSANGLADRSLRELASAIGSSHRMLHYHFGSRAGLVAAVVEAVEGAQRALLSELAGEIDDPVELARALWVRTVAPEMLPFVRLFFECVGLTGGQGLTDPWLALSSEVGERIGVATDEDELRLGVAVTRGLLIDVLASGDAIDATRSFERFLAMWVATREG
ncbi:MAG: TetR/AcrR family transcriptional regulator [Dehalococcoidia bacterium]